LTVSKDFNKFAQSPHILVAPLDWGLGHATRCITIIYELINAGCHVSVAADGKTAILLKKEFPDLNLLPLKGYHIHYSRSPKWFFFSLLIQFPRIFITIQKEHRWLKKNIRLHKFDAVISDNRFGLHSSKVPSVYITHQLNISTGFRVTDWIAGKIHRYYISKFDRCWIPDAETNGLAGKLSHSKTVTSNVEYVGPLSRFVVMNDAKIKYDVLILLSGPEPQRSIFEQLIVKQLHDFEGNVFMVRGLPGESVSIPEFKNVTIKNHLAAGDLNEIISQSRLVICRSGYTSVMDLVKLHKKAIFVPTPGQGEQEYLASYLLQKHLFYSVMQDKFNLPEAINAASSFDFAAYEGSLCQYKVAVDELVKSLNFGNFAPL
jgi:uncharacterized protein (TIGR00661 family)